MSNNYSHYALLKKTIFFCLFSFVVFFLASGCKKDDEEIPVTESTAGLGSSEENPTGTPFSFPLGISLASEIQGYSEECLNTEPRIGSGIGYVDLCISLTNSFDHNIKIKFPPGLIFTSKTKETQNGLLIKEDIIEVPKNATISWKISLYCLNEGRSGAYFSDLFLLGPVTQNKNLLELIKLLEGKNFNNFGAYEEGAIQEAVWNITDHGGLTAEDRQTINELENK